MNPHVLLQDVSFGYGARQVLTSIDLTARGSEFIVVAGVNGAGKSTLLDIVAGLRQPQSGTVVLNGRALNGWAARERAQTVSHLPQGTKQELPFTVEQVVLMGRYAHADRWFESAQDRAAAESAMERMNCADFRGRLFSTLSGGEQQRVLLAACIAQRPSVMLFDEPSTYLDVHQQLQCFSTLAELAREGALCIAVTHDLNLALTYCTRMLILDRGALAADFATHQAAAVPEWLSKLSPQLRMSETADGRPWVHYR